MSVLYSSHPCSIANNANSIVCNFNAKEDKEVEEMTDKEAGEEWVSCENVQERRQENENDASAVWEKAAHYWPEHVSTYVCVHVLHILCTVYVYTYVCNV